MYSLVYYPGTAVGYHTLTYGLYADQLVRRVDKHGRGLGQFFREEIAKPFGKYSVNGFGCY